MSKVVNIEGISLSQEAIRAIKELQRDNNEYLKGNVDGLVDLTYFLIRNRHNFSESEADFDEYLLNIACVRESLLDIAKPKDKEE